MKSFDLLPDGIVTVHGPDDTLVVRASADGMAMLRDVCGQCSDAREVARCDDWTILNAVVSLGMLDWIAKIKKDGRQAVSEG